MSRVLGIIVWVLVSLLGMTAVAVIAFVRSEPVNALWLVVAAQFEYVELAAE